MERFEAAFWFVHIQAMIVLLLTRAQQRFIAQISLLFALLWNRCTRISTRARIPLEAQILCFAQFHLSHPSAAHIGPVCLAEIQILSFIWSRSDRPPHPGGRRHPPPSCGSNEALWVAAAAANEDDDSANVSGKSLAEVRGGAWRETALCWFKSNYLIFCPGLEQALMSITNTLMFLTPEMILKHLIYISVSEQRQLHAGFSLWFTRRSGYDQF